MRESSRTIETRLARLTLAGLGVYAPLETIASWQMVGGVQVLVHPGFLQSLVAFGLLLWGSMRSLRARPRPAPAILCIAHAWCASVFWHASTVRLAATERGMEMFYGTPELWTVWAGTIAALTFFSCSLWLTVRTEARWLDAPASPGSLIPRA
jgi:hypothetical protein